MDLPQCDRRRHRPWDPRRPPARGADGLPRRTGRTMPSAGPPRGRRQGHLHQRARALSDRALLPHRPLPGARAGRGPWATLSPFELNFLASTSRAEADRAGGLSGLPGGHAVQRERPDAARRLPDPAADGQPHADRDGPHERVGARDGARGWRGAHDYPLVSSHTGTGGLWTPAELRLLYRLGGFAAARAGHGARAGARIEDLQGDRSKRHVLRRRARHRHRRLLVAPGAARGRGPGAAHLSRSASSTATCSFTASRAARAPSTSTPTASRTTACSPT